jgi:DnaJ-class molecular chaperone
MTTVLETRTRTCWRCGGTKALRSGEQCPACTGSGAQVYWVPVSDEPYTPPEYPVEMLVGEPHWCPSCDTAPQATNPNCPRCGGTGIVTETVYLPDGRVETRQSTCGC